MNERDYVRELEVTESVIADGARRFCREAATPIRGIQAIPDLQFLDAVDDLKKETAIANSGGCLPAK